MKWSLDTHKYISEIPRTALQILVKHNISSKSSNAEIDVAEQELASAGVYQDYSSAKGRIRRALFTYFRSYECFDDAERLTELGKLFSENRLSIREMSFAIIVNKAYYSNGSLYYPVFWLLVFLEKARAISPQEAYITPYDFLRIEDCGSLSDINDSFVSELIAKRQTGLPVVDEREIGFDVWSKMLVQGGIFDKDKSSHVLSIKNERLFEWMIKTYRHPNIKKVYGSISSGILNFFPSIGVEKAKGDPSAFLNESTALQAFLFDSINPELIDKYFLSEKRLSFTRMLASLGLTVGQEGFYSAFSGIERLVGINLSSSPNQQVRTIGKILASIIGKTTWEENLTMKEETKEQSQAFSGRGIGVDYGLSPEWFNEKADDYPSLDKDAQDYLQQFFARFDIKKLADLNGKELLNVIFLNNDNKTNLCYVLEFDTICREIFGSIKSGTAYKYGLHYSKKNKAWATGSSTKPVFLSEEEAIELGTHIRDFLIAGAELIAETKVLESEEDYLKLYNELDDVTGGYINRVWFLKYYAMLYPNLFPPFYSFIAQTKALNRLKLEAKSNPISRLAELSKFVKQCNISNVMFGKIFWTYCNGDEIEIEELSEGETMKNCLEIVRPVRTKKDFPLNAIIYGAPGTGKTYSTAEYALAIIERRSVDLSFKTPDERKRVMETYNAYVKSGQVVFTTFHQNYGYEEFVQGLRPDVQSEEMSFKVVDGVFKKIADKALNETDPSKNYVIIIDEINRANISKVLGELITLIEEDKRWGEVNQTCVTLQSGDLFAVPNNLYILGTMNSADKSISLIDAALRRRFEFIEQKPIPELVDDSELRKVFKKLNDTLAEELQSSDLLIGHSYFMGKTIKELPKIMNNNIVPLLYEYFYDNKKKVMSVLTDVLKDTGYEPIDEVLGRVSVKKKEQ